MVTRLKKATFSLDRRVLDELAEAVASGAAPSKNALVERALRRELAELRRRAREALWKEAAADPMVVRDVEDTEAAFRRADAESARGIG